MLDLHKRWQLFAIQPFRWYFLSCILATLGGGLIYINLTWIALKSDNSIAVVALLMLSFWLPVIVLGPIAGVIADRFSRRKLIVISDFIRAFVILIFLLLWFLGMPMRVWQFCLMNVIQGVGLGFILPATMAYVREIIDEDKLLFANSTVDIGYEMGNVIGMGFAGLLIALTSIQVALLLNAVCFILAGAAVLWSKPCVSRNIRKASSTVWQTIKNDYVEGLRYLKNNDGLMVIYMVQLFIMAMFMTSPVLLAPFAKNILHANVSQFGQLEAMISVGVVLGGIITPSLANKFGAFKIILIELTILLLAFLVFSTVRVLSEALILNFLLGFGLSAWPVILTQAQKMTDLNYQGRVQSTFNSISGVVVLGMYFLLATGGPHMRLSLMYLIQALLALFAILLFCRCRPRLA